MFYLFRNICHYFKVIFRYFTLRINAKKFTIPINYSEIKAKFIIIIIITNVTTDQNFINN